MLKPITSLEDIEVGQLVNDGKKTKKVLAKSGLLVWLSLAENHDEVCAGYTIKRIIEKKMTVDACTRCLRLGYAGLEAMGLHSIRQRKEY